MAAGRRSGQAGAAVPCGVLGLLPSGAGRPRCPGKRNRSLLMVKAGERVRRCAYRRGQNEPHRGEAGMPEQGYCGLPGSATAEPDLVLPGLRWR